MPEVHDWPAELRAALEKAGINEEEYLRNLPHLRNPNSIPPRWWRNLIKGIEDNS